MERGKLCTDASSALLSKVSPVESCWSGQEKGTSGGSTRPKTDAVHSGGSTRSSAEASVMGVERRGRIISSYN